jgi:hypothetical protein
MNSSEDLMRRLAVSKKIMDRQEGIKTNGLSGNRISTPVVEGYEPVSATYNIPQDIISESTPQTPLHDPTKPIDSNRILNSKLPDEIKRLMIEQPIVQPSSIGGSAQISEEVIQGAQRLMNMGKTTNTQPSRDERVTENYQTSNINISEIKNIVRDVVRDTVRDVVREELKDAGMLVESTQNSNEVIQFKVGQHLFVGRVTKIKKLQK